jgi:hypothetical protein
MIKTLSPYYVTIPFVAPLSELTCTDFTLKLYIWNGSILDVPATATYEITKKNPTSSTGSTKINIARLLSDYIDFNPSISTTTEVVNANNQEWLKWETVYTTSDAEDATTPTNENTELFLKGYSYGIDGENQSTPTNKILIPLIDYKVSPTTTFVFPFVVDELSSQINVTSQPNNVISGEDIALTFLLSYSDLSGNIVRNLIINTLSALGEDSIEITYNEQTVTLLIQEECRYTPIDIFYQNKEGALASFTFFKKAVESIDVTSELFESDRGQPFYGYHQYTTYNVQAKKKFNVNSGFVSEDTNEVFKQILLSERIWKYENEKLIPLTISSKTLEFKTRANDRLINYNIQFEYAFNDINNI